MSNKELAKGIIDELLKCVERVKLAERMQAKADEDRSELKARVKQLLDKISREKELKQAHSDLQNERAFQDTIQVLQKELNRTRRQIRQQK